MRTSQLASQHFPQKFSRRLAIFGLLSSATLALMGCQTTETSKTVTPQQVSAAATTYNGIRHSVVIGKFDNRSSFLRGLFSDGIDRLGGQSKTILITHLQQTGRFNVLDRANLDEAKFESAARGQTQAIKGAEIIITGDVTEFGRKEVGDQAFFGILGRGKTQVAYSKVALNVINGATSEIIYSVQGAGEYELSNREILGFGSTASYDSTLNGKVLDLAIREAVNRLTEGLEQGKVKLQ